MDEEHAPGWDAIDAALEKLYGQQKPLHFGASVPFAAGGEDPLTGISVYKSKLGGRAHWHFVTYGFSELFDKESDDPSTSGYGFEMTVRVVDPESKDEPPKWVLSLLQNLARYVFNSGNVFEAGHYTTLNGPIALGRETQLVAAAFAQDPELETMTTEHGEVAFVQLVGLTGDEYDAIRDWDSAKMTALMQEKDKALLTDLVRESTLKDKVFAKKVKEGVEKEGSSMAAVFSTKGEIDAEKRIFGVAANSLEDLGRLLRGRLPFGRDATLIWPGGSATIVAGDETKIDDDTLTLSEADRKAILEIPVKRGDYPLPSGKVTLQVIPIKILDGKRKKVERTVG